MNINLKSAINIFLFLTIIFFNSASLLFASEGAGHAAVNPLMIIPFALLLLSIAAFPLINAHWWEKNYPYVSSILGAIVIVYYIFVVGNVSVLFHTGMEYISFISLVGSLFVITGCILLKIDRKSTPLVNIGILLFGSIFANIVGTTGASAFLIRSYLKINKNRLKPYHIVFFIFIVSNVGGSLTPIGDPPLFLGYLKGVPFFWTLTNLWHIWAIGVISLLSIFYVLELKNKGAVNNGGKEEQFSGKIRIEGAVNFVYLGFVLLSVFLPTPYREIIMIGSAFAAYKTSPQNILEANGFNFHPIKEVTILFFGIFSCMIPALQWLEQNAASLGINTPGQFYWGSGFLSAVLDNAPTYLNFLSAAFGLHNIELINSNMPAFLSDHGHFVQAISVAAVFFGAMTYIGNAPNFMIKSISEQNGADVPDFLTYIYKYSLPILLPIFIIIWFLFFA